MSDGWTGAEATALRKALRLSIVRFAATLEVSPRTVANWAAHPDMAPRVALWDRLDGLLASATTNAKARFAKLCDRHQPTECKQAHPIDASALYEALDNLSARLSLVERLIAGPSTAGLHSATKESAR